MISKIRQKEMSYLSKILLREKPKINIVLSGPNADIPPLLRQLQDTTQNGFEASSTLRPAFIDLDMQYRIINSWKKLCNLIMAQKVEFQANMKDSPKCLKRWVLLREYWRLRSEFERLNNDPKITPKFLKKQLDTITPLLTVFPDYKRPFVPVLFIDGAQSLKYLELRETTPEETQENENALNLFLQWLNEIPSVSQEKKTSILLSTSDSLFPNWLKTKIGPCNVRTHVIGYLTEAEAHQLYEHTIREIQLTPGAGDSFEHLYEIVGGDPTLIVKLLEDRKFGTPFMENKRITMIIRKIEEALQLKKDQEEICKPPGSIFSDPLVKWDPALLLELYRKIDETGYVRWSEYKDRKDELISIIEHGFLFYCEDKTLTGEEGQVNEAVIVANAPVERYAIRKALQKLN